MYVISREGMRLACSLGCNDIAALSPWERYIVYPFRLIAINQILCMIRVEAAKLAQTGFGDFLADAVWAGWRVSVTTIKGCIVDTICNSAGHK